MLWTRNNTSQKTKKSVLVFISFYIEDDDRRRVVFGVDCFDPTDPQDETNESFLLINLRKFELLK